MTESTATDLSTAADALEAEYLKVANGEIKPAKMCLEPLVRAVQAMRAASPTPSPISDHAAGDPIAWSAKQLYDAIEKILLSYQLSNWQDQYDSALGLVDRLCDHDAKDIASGQHQVRLICDEIYNEVLTVTAPTTGSAPVAEATADMKEGRWCPDECPITGMRFFMWMGHPDLGYVPTYGGPFDSYTIAEPDEDGYYRAERYDHDAGGWIDGGEPVHVRDELMVTAEIEDAAPPANAPVASVLSDAELSAIDTAACEWTDDWSERQELTPSKEACNAMFIRRVIALLAASMGGDRK